VEVAFSQKDVLTVLPEKGCYDVIVSNPPYIAEKEKAVMDANVLDWEPSLALFVPDEDPLLFYRRIAELAKEMLAEGGSLYYEINQAYGLETVQMLESLGYSSIELRKDAFGNDRMIKADRP
jgi:release factor glutamine methyltransferase